MACCMLLLTNNPRLFTAGHSRLDVHTVDGTAHDVLCAARDKVHMGWRLLNHPLYGNFRPYHQPFRTVALQAPEQEAAACPAPIAAVDAESLHLLEQAFAVYNSCERLWATPQNVPQEMYDDCAVIDEALMSATLAHIS